MKPDLSSCKRKVDVFVVRRENESGPGFLYLGHTHNMTYNEDRVSWSSNLMEADLFDLNWAIRKTQELSEYGKYIVEVIPISLGEPVYSTRDEAIRKKNQRIKDLQEEQKKCLAMVETIEEKIKRIEEELEKEGAL